MLPVETFPLTEKRILFSYAAHKAHLNFVPTGPALKPFRDDRAGYATGKDSVRFPYDTPLPRALNQKIAAHRAEDVRQNDARWMYGIAAIGSPVHVQLRHAGPRSEPRDAASGRPGLRVRTAGSKSGAGGATRNGRAAVRHIRRQRNEVFR